MNNTHSFHQRNRFNVTHIIQKAQKWLITLIISFIIYHVITLGAIICYHAKFYVPIHKAFTKPFHVHFYSYIFSSKHILPDSDRLLSAHCQEKVSTFHRYVCLAKNITDLAVFYALAFLDSKQTARLCLIDFLNKTRGERLRLGVLP